MKIPRIFPAVLTAAAVFITALPGQAGPAALDVVSVQFRKDPDPPDAKGGMLFVYLRGGRSAAKEDSLRINGEPPRVWHERQELAWWRLRPDPLPPGVCGELALRFHKLPAQERLRLELGGAACNVPLSPSSLRMVSAAFTPNLQSVILVVERSGGWPRTISDVRIDGESVWSRCKTTSPVFFHDVAVVQVELPRPWPAGSYHVLHVKGKPAGYAAAQVRAWSLGFEVGTFGSHFFEEFGSHGMNTYQSFGWLPREKLDKAHAEGLRVAMPFFNARWAYFYDRLPLDEVERRFHETGRHPAMLAHYLEDEPDVFDWHYPATFRQEVTFRFPRAAAIQRAVFEGLDARGVRCVLEVPAGREWKPVARHDSWAEPPDRRKPVPLELKFDPVGTESLRLVIERCRVIPQIAEAHFFDADGKDHARGAKAEATTRMDRFYGRRDQGPEKMVDGDPDTSWWAGHSYRYWSGSMAMEMVRRETFGKKLVPELASMLLADNTFRPENFFAYGHVADVFDHDIYLRPKRGETMDLEEVARRTEPVRRSCEPKPLWITLWMGWGMEYCRALTAAEERIMAFYAVGAGAKGINYFLYSGGTYDVRTGMAKTGRKAEGEALWEGVGRLNRQLRLAGPWLARAYPVAAEVEAPNGLWVRTLVSGLDALAVIVVNQRVRGTGEGCESAPIRDAILRIEPLPWLREVKAERVTPAGFEPIPLEMDRGRWTLKLPIVNDGEMLLLRRQ